MRCYNASYANASPTMEPGSAPDVMAALLLLAAYWLLYDGVAGLSDWRGLRSTPLPPAAALGLAALAAAALLVVVGPPSTASVALMAPAGLALHFTLAAVLGRGLSPDPWTGPGSWEQHRTTEARLPLDGGSIPALFYEPIGQSRGVMVLVHGAGAHKSFYTWPLVDALLAVGLAVCAIDLDGHGENERVLDFPSVLEDVHAAVGWLRERTDWVGVVGISLGGCIAARAAADGLALDALAVVESPVAIDVTPRVRRNEYLTLGRPATWSLHRYAGTLPLARAWATQPVRTRVSTVDLIRRLDLLGSVARVQCPLWLGYGGSDLVVPVAHARAVAAAAPEGTPLVLVPRATHLSLPLERRALRALQRWLVDLQGSTAGVTAADRAA